MDIKALANEAESYVIDRRRYYHAHPELSDHEENTRAQIHRDLEALGITDIREMQQCYGLVATIHGGHPGKTVGLRTDIDALPIQEETGLPFASENPGCMHACGHDGHIAMLLGAAKILQEHREELHGNVRLIVQPSEESGFGSRYMLRENALEGVDALFGAHIWGTLDAPLIDVTPGNRMAGADLFDVTVEGTSAHASTPQLGNDAITAAAAVITNLQQYVSRMNDPLNPLVVGIGTIQGGTRFNVVPNHVFMTATLRSFTTERHEQIVKQITENTAAALGCKGTVDYRYIMAPVINRHEDLNRIARNAVVKLYGEAGIGHLPTMMGSEDFSWYMAEVPSFFAFVGSRNPAAGNTATNHQECYSIDEGALQRGTALMAQFAVDYLAENA